jgi:hypothetical protein
MTAKETGIKYERGLTLLNEGMRALLDEYNSTGDVTRRSKIEQLAIIGKSLNIQQQNMVIGWLGKRRVGSVEEALGKINTRIEKDNNQSNKTSKLLG